MNPRKVPGGLKLSISSKIASVPADAEPPVVEDHPEMVAEILRNAS